MKGQDDDFREQSAAFWSHQTGKTVSKEEASEMNTNLAGFIEVLLDWDRREREEGHERRERK